MELSKFCKKALFFRHSHPCHAEPKGSEKLQINISFLCTFLNPNTGSFVAPWHYSSPLPLKSYSESQKLHSKAVNSIVCSEGQVWHNFYLHHCMCLLLIPKIQLVCSLPLHQHLPLLRHVFIMTKLCPLEHWDRLPVKLRQSLLNILIKVGSRSLKNWFIISVFLNPLLLVGVSKKGRRCQDQNKQKGRIPHNMHVKVEFREFFVQNMADVISLKG